MRRLLFCSLSISGLIFISASCHTQKKSGTEPPSQEVSTPATQNVQHDTVNKNVEIKHQGQDQKKIDSIKEIKNRKKGF